MGVAEAREGRRRGPLTAQAPGVGSLEPETPPLHTSLPSLSLCPCDNAMMKIKELAFFFSSIAVLEKKVNENDLDDDQDGEDEMKGTSQGKKTIFWSAISYWIAQQSWDGMRVYMSTIRVHSVLLETEVEETR
ncbi:hypothetical protein ACROYT_G003874 [Oculina patagonica]